MRDFGPKRPVSEDTVKAKRGRPKKKPNYDKDKMIQDQLEKAVALFVEPYDDREKRSDDAPSLSEVARQLGTTTIRARKMLITAGYYTTKASRRIQELHDSGANMQEIIAATGMKEASIYCYLPYSKGVYNLADPTLCAEQNRLFRKRKAACVTLGEHLDDPESEKFLWETLEAFENYLFLTAKGLPFRYTLKGGEIFFDRKGKSVTRATVVQAFLKAREEQEKVGFVSGPKKLGTFGASYLYAVFLRIGVCEKGPEKG